MILPPKGLRGNRYVSGVGAGWARPGSCGRELPGEPPKGYLRAMPPSASQPTPARGTIAFEHWDFEALAPSHERNREVDDRRLAARRKLAALAKTVVSRAADVDLALDSRTSLHHPHAFNGGRVRRLWAYVCRPKKEKTRLRRVLGADLAGDLDAAYRNAYLSIAIEHGALEVALRIHVDGWYDGQNLVKRLHSQGQDGLRHWLEILNRLDGFRLRLHDWKGEWRCGELSLERLEEYLKHYTPGEHELAIERRWPVPTSPDGREPILGPDVPVTLVDEATRLFEAYDFAAWSERSDFLFG